MTFFQFFTDPLLNMPMIGSALVGFVAALMGTFAFVRKRLLIGEALAHAAFPGVVLGMFISIAFPLVPLNFLIMVMALLLAGFSMYVMQVMQKRGRSSDTALCFVLSTFLGAGLLLASLLQAVRPALYRGVHIFFYGQASTLTEVDVMTYAILAISVLLFVVLFFRSLLVMHFDKAFACLSGMRIKWLEIATSLFTALAIVVGMRSVGVVLISGMFIAPAVFARGCTQSFGKMLCLSGVIGIISGVLGNYVSVMLPVWSGNSMSLPTGPVILLIACFFAGISLLFAPERGLAVRLYRSMSFRMTCHLENLLKEMWSGKKACSVNPLVRAYLLKKMQYQGWVSSSRCLTKDGEKKAERLVRLHRLWEVYLVDFLGADREKVHCNAEEMEHIITPELEEKLTVLLKDPKLDPHAQPIPTRRGTI